MAYLRNTKSAQSQEKGELPHFYARVNSGVQKNGKPFYQTIGAAWRTEINGMEAISLKLNSLPLDFNGSILLLQPIVDEEEAAKVASVDAPKGKSK